MAPDTVSMTMSRLLAGLACITLAGCANLLPKVALDTPSPFESCEQAHAAVERIEPFKTNVGELVGFGFDVAGQRNVTLIAYPDLVGRLAPNSSIPLVELDPGIRDCIRARDACRVYSFHFANEKRERRGSFLADFFNFERTTAISGWRLDALIVVRGDLVLFRNFSGEPGNLKIEHERNPLGPLQSAGDQLIGAAVR